MKCYNWTVLGLGLVALNRPKDLAGPTAAICRAARNLQAANGKTEADLYPAESWCISGGPGSTSGAVHSRHRGRLLCAPETEPCTGQTPAQLSGRCACMSNWA